MESAPARAMNFGRFVVGAESISARACAVTTVRFPIRFTITAGFPNLSNLSGLSVTIIFPVRFPQIVMAVLKMHL